MSEFTDELRSRINPAYANQIGTESYERRVCAEHIERLELEALAADIRMDNDRIELIDKQFSIDGFNSIYVKLMTERAALKHDLAKAQEATVNNCARVLELANEITGWKADQAENLSNQCELVGQLQQALIDRDEWKARCEFSFGQRDNLEKVIDGLTREQIGLKLDAQRYQFIREDGVYVLPDGRFAPTVRGEALDILTDIAIQKGGVE